jgi:arylsulfatase
LASPHHTQYFALHGHRAIWNDGWKAVTEHKEGDSFDADRWELYNLNDDYSESHDLAARYPEKLEELKKLWWNEATKYGVLPLDGRGIGDLAAMRTNPAPKTASWTLYPGQTRVPVGSAANFSKNGFTIEATVDRASAKSEGILLSVGDTAAGYVLYLKDNQLIFDNNNLGTHEVVRSSAAVPVGKSVLTFSFTPAEKFKGTGTLRINSEVAGTAQVTISPAVIAFGGIEVGRDSLAPVSQGYAGKGDFSFPEGQLEKVVIRPNGGEQRSALTQ